MQELKSMNVQRHQISKQAFQTESKFVMMNSHRVAIQSRDSTVNANNSANNYRKKKIQWE